MTNGKRYLLTRVGVLAGTVLLSACATLRSSLPSPGPQSSDASARIFIDRRGWHVDIGFATAQLVGPLSSSAKEFPDARYLIFGFGDRRYLVAKGSRSIDLVAAIWPGKGVILVTGLQVPPAEAFGGHVISLALTPTQARAAQAFVWRSLVHTDGLVHSIAEGPYEGSRYFATMIRYSGIHTCNTWVAEALQSAGLPIRSRGVIFARQIWRQIRRLAELQTGSARSPHSLSSRTAATGLALPALVAGRASPV